MLSRTPAVILLIIVNVLIFLLCYAQAETFEGNAWTLTLLKFGGQFNPYTLGGEWYRIFSHMFLHAHWLHLFVNMMALFSVGRGVEEAVGTTKFLVVYLLCGVGGSFASLYGTMFTLGVGASGAIFGLLGFMLVLNIIHLRREGQGLTPLLVNFAIFLFINIAVGQAFHADHYAHFGGLATGGLLAAGNHFFHSRADQYHTEAAMSAIMLVIFFVLPRFQVHYYQAYRQVVAAEREGKAISNRKLTDQDFLNHLGKNQSQWDSAKYAMDQIRRIPDKLRGDVVTLSNYVHFRSMENTYQIRMIRDQKYILLDSLHLLQDSIRKYTQLEYPVPLYENFEAGAAETPASLSNEENTLRPVQVWYDSSWIEINRPGPYYRIGSRDSLQRWQGWVTDYYADGKTQMKGYYHDDRRDGIFLYYSHHDTYTSAGRYLNNRSIGKWQMFHNNGLLKSEVFYDNGVYYKNIWDSLGNVQVADGAGVVEEFYGDGIKKAEIPYRDGKPEGAVTGWHPDGTMHYKEDYLKGLLVYGRARNAKGEEFIYDGSSLQPQPHRGYPEFEKYLAKATTSSNIRTGESVRLSFRVTAAGVTTDFEIERADSPEAGKEAIAIVQRGPRWEPAKLHGYQRSDGYVWLTINFGETHQ